MIRPGKIHRIAALYAIVERVRSAEWQLACAGVREVEQLAAMHFDEGRTAEARGRAQLAAGDRAEWLLAEVSREFAQMRLHQLAEPRAAREVLREEAAEAHRESRLRKEQIDQVVSSATKHASAHEARVNQNVADDRYASRRDWQRRQRQ